MKLPNAPKPCKLLLTSLALSLTACATTLPPSACNCPALPVMPSINTPTPPQSFSENAAGLIKSWRERLTESLQSAKP